MDRWITNVYFKFHNVCLTDKFLVQGHWATVGTIKDNHQDCKKKCKMCSYIEQ